jgi:hypothetical protein
LCAQNIHGVCPTTGTKKHDAPAGVPLKPGRHMPDPCPDRVRMEQSHVETYEVTADELDRIEEEGSDVGFDFHIALFCLTMATSFLLGLILSPPPDDKPKTFVVLVVLVIVGFLLGLIFGIKWFMGRGSFQIGRKSSC